jgi:hypothetical protein
VFDPASTKIYRKYGGKFEIKHEMNRKSTK